MSDPAPPPSLSSFLRLPGRVLDRLLPRGQDLAPALLGALVGLLPLMALRRWVAVQIVPDAIPRDLHRVNTGEIEAWCIIALIGAVVVRHSGRFRPWARAAYHATCTGILGLSVVELVFCSVTGGRADVELLAFFLADLAQIAPVFVSEVKLTHLVCLVVACLVGASPLLFRFTSVPSRLGWLSVLLVVPVWQIEKGGRNIPRRELKMLQPGLAELLYWDAMERSGDTTIPPAASSLEPIRLVRERPYQPLPAREAGAAPDPAAALPNIVFIVLESTAAKSTSVYNKALGTTPQLATLATFGRPVQNAYSVVPHTSKSLVSSLCGTWPQLQTDVSESDIGGLPQRCLPELLQEFGYRTAFFQTADETYENRASLAHRLGFDHFRARDTLRGPAFLDVNYFGIEERAMLEPGLAWSAEGGPFFATYLTLTTHHDYGTPAHWPAKAFPGVKPRQAQYFNGVRYVDDFVGKLVAGYEARGLADNTLFVIFGDHGEAFGEHGRSMHDLVIWDEGLRIPMVLYGPGVIGVGDPITGDRQQIDLLPTVLDLLGLRAEGGSLPGTSLFKPAPDRPLFHSCWRSHRCQAVRDDGAKTIDHFRDGPMQHFDTVKDPGERADLSRTLPPGALDALRAEMKDWRARVRGRYAAVLAAALEARQSPDTSPALATWGGKLDMLGCTIENTKVIPAERVWLQCRWRAREHMRQAWRVDVSVDGAFAPHSENEHPVDGLLPTFQWAPGVAIEDEVSVRIPADAKPGIARVYVGWERYGDGRLEMASGGNRCEVGTVEVGEPLYPYDGAAQRAVGDVPDEDPEG